MKYFKLNQSSTRWIETERNESKRTIEIFDFINGKMILKGIGQY